jgi:hypothetical protein
MMETLNDKGIKAGVRTESGLHTMTTCTFQK